MPEAFCGWPVNLGRSPPQWRVFVAYAGRTAFVKSLPAKVFAEAEARRLRREYPDPKAEFWASSAAIRPTGQWSKIEPRLSRSGGEKSIFGESTKEQADFRVRTAIRKAIHEERAQRRIDPGFAFLPYTVRELMGHIAGQFRDGMSWANYGEWVIDHIEPRAAFDMRDPKQLMRCWSLGNLQPLWAEENQAKIPSDKQRIRAA